jgi:enoyl-CoA hydratase/carnithine racemase
MELATENMIAEKQDGIGWMVFNNPERHNALSYEMRLAMLQIMDDFAADDGVRVMVMKGAGKKAFVSGADISQFEKLRNTPEQQAEYHALSEKVQVRFDTMEKPVIAMIQGYCLGGGLGTALNADVRIASDDARFGIPAARLSIGYPFAGIKRLIDLVGPAYAKEILFTAHRFTAQEAYAMGLVNRVVPVDELEEVVRTMAATMADNAPLTLRSAKAIVAEALKDPADRDLELCDTLVKACMTSNDYVEGRRAFMEKRKPEFTGT